MHLQQQRLLLISCQACHAAPHCQQLLIEYPASMGISTMLSGVGFELLGMGVVGMREISMGND
jgi:hypothetical protein